VSQPVDAASLGDALAPSSHKDEGLSVLQRFLGGLPTNDRLVWLATNLLTPPLTHSEAEARAGAPIELFNILQGDIIRTGAAYQMGSRNEVGTYIVATSTCELVPGRRTTALLLPVQAKRGDEFSSATRLAAELDALTLFKPRKHFHLRGRLQCGSSRSPCRDLERGREPIAEASIPLVRRMARLRGTR